MRIALITLALFCGLTSGPAPTIAQEKTTGPASDKAKKDYKEAENFLHQREDLMALDSFKRADKDDGGHCRACQKQVIKYAVEVGDWKTAQFAAQEEIAEAQGDKETALADY